MIVEHFRDGDPGPCIARTGGSQAPLLESAAVFFLGYLRSELLRRKSRTILTCSGSPWVCRS